MNSNTAPHSLNQESLEGLRCLAREAVNLKASGGKRTGVKKGERDAMDSVWFAHPETHGGVLSPLWGTRTKGLGGD